jgi:Cd(II)/Pb(II)-responsive transcriptional regulator
MNIGDLARQSGVSVETIRYYEREALLPPPQRTLSNYRVYSDAHADRLRFVVNCRALDMTLEEIRSLLKFHDRPSENCRDVNRLLDQHIGHVAERVAELQRLGRQLRKLRRACLQEKHTGDCGILLSLRQPRAMKPKGLTHVRGQGS